MLLSRADFQITSTGPLDEHIANINPNNMDLKLLFEFEKQILEFKPETAENIQMVSG
jgi:hypothetical protein